MALDLSTLFHTSVGFDHLNRLLEEVAQNRQINSYPPYNIVKVSDELYRITVALAGFSEKELSIVLEDSILSISSPGLQKVSQAKFLYKGIANRAFEKKFQLAENIKIEGAYLFQGILSINLLKVPPKIMAPEKIRITLKKPDY